MPFEHEGTWLVELLLKKGISFDEIRRIVGYLRSPSARQLGDATELAYNIALVRSVHGEGKVTFAEQAKKESKHVDVSSHKK